MPSRTLPASLPARIYLLACDVDKHRLRGANLGVVVRGAALAELNLQGLLTEDGGTVRVSGSRRTGDPVLDGMLRQMSEDRPRNWRGWMRRGGRQTLTAVRQQLVSAGLITTQPGRVLGVFPTTRITVTDPAQAAALRRAIREAATGDGPVSRVSTKDAALVALVAVGELRSVVSRHDCRVHADRIAEFTERAGSAIPALQRVIRQIRSARAAAASGG
jgi:hypothetical protein